MKDKTLTDILLISKGWYNKLKYRDTLEAFGAYYHKHYGCEDIVMDKAFAENLFLRPLVLKAIEIKPTLARYIFDPLFGVIDNEKPFTETMYDREIALIQMINHDMFDLSEYEDMFAREKACNYKDETIGII